jgi:hypothetical protein
LQSVSSTFIGPFRPHCLAHGCYWYWGGLELFQRCARTHLDPNLDSNLHIQFRNTARLCHRPGLRLHLHGPPFHWAHPCHRCYNGFPAGWECFQRCSGVCPHLEKFPKSVVAAGPIQSASSDAIVVMPTWEVPGYIFRANRR